jgi:hypothetical protein
MCAPASLDCRHLLVDQLDEVVVAGDAFEQWWRGDEDINVLRAQEEPGLLDQMLGVGGGLVGLAGGNELFYPARVQVNGEHQTTASPGLRRGDRAHHMRTGGQHAEPVDVARHAVRIQLTAHPRDGPLPPVAQEHHPLGGAGGAAALIDTHNVGIWPVAPRDQILHPHVAQLIDDVGGTMPSPRCS